jgi:hypothetical protein
MTFIGFGILWFLFWMAMWLFQGRKDEAEGPY